MKKHTDQTGRDIQLKDRLQRIISLVPSQTELLYDLGLNEKLVGITKFCVHPKNLRREKEIVGGTKGVEIKKIKALKPDIILGNKEENTRKMVEELEEIAPVHLSDVDTVQDALEMIEAYGKLFHIEKKAASLKEKITGQRRSFQEKLREKKNKSLRVAYFIWRKPWMVVGNQTFINTLIEEQGWENAFADLERYPLIKLSDLPKCDLILLSSEPFPFAEKHKEEIAEYVDPEKIIFVDGEYFSWYGSRLIEAYDYFEKLHRQIST